MDQFRSIRCVAMLATVLASAGGIVRADTPKQGGPVYLSRTWFHRGPDVNLLTTPAGQQLMVDNQGRYLTDGSINRDLNRFIKLSLDSAKLCDGNCYMALQTGFHGSQFHWFRVSTGGQFLRSKALGEEVQAQEHVHKPVGETIGFYCDFDPVRGDAGMLLFPKIGLTVTCARATNDARAIAVAPFGTDGKAAPFTAKDSVQLPFTTKGRGSARAEGNEFRVLADPDRQGFWYLCEHGGKLMAVHGHPGLKSDGGRTLGLSQAIAVGDASTEAFEAGVAGREAVYLLLAHKDASIGGVNAKRTLVRVSLDTGRVATAEVSFKRYIRDARLALCGDRLAAYARHKLVVVDRKTLEPVWQKSSEDLSENSSKDYRIYRACANKDGTQLAVALATAYRHPGEPTRVAVLNASGHVEKNWLAKPGSVDDLTFTKDGGVLLFSGSYTAKLGGVTPVLKNEVASIATAGKHAVKNKANKSSAGPASKFTFLKTPLKDRHKIWFDHPGGDFLPMGNGELGAMMYGGTDTARAIFNVDSMWYGDEHHQGTYTNFAEVDFVLGQDPQKVTDYRRTLDLRTGIYTVSYRYNGVTYKREAFCSYPRGLWAIRFTASKPGSLSGSLQLEAKHDAKFSKNKQGIAFSGQLSNGEKFACDLRLEARGGQVLAEQGRDGVHVVQHRRHSTNMPYNGIKLQGCDSFTLYVAGDTNYAPDPAHHFFGKDPQQKIAPRIANVSRMTFDQMAAESAADVSSLFDRCTLDLATDTPQDETLPIDKRHTAYRGALYRDQPADLGFQQLGFDASRYMMIACSRPGTLPANLQGMWNADGGAAWTGDYHTDINIEMNYWFVEPANLSDCAMPLFAYIHSQIPFWRQTTKQYFGKDVPGWTVQYMNNIYGAGTYMVYPPGSAWLSWNYAQHFEFGQDTQFLKDRAYPVLKDLSEQWQDVLIKRPNGELTTPKTMSPEHPPQQFGISQDREMVYGLLTNYIGAARRLNRDAGFVEKVEGLRSHIVPPQIGRWGQLQEWEIDRDSRFCHHRHMMHEFAAFPGRQINPSQTPQLAAAAIKSLEARGKGRSGWSMAWRGSLYARLGKPEKAYDSLAEVISTFHANLIWQGRNQIDAPCGYASGICEMLLQSYKPLDETDTRFEIDLLPALPKQWPTGRVNGLRARGGFTVDEAWQDGRLTKAVIYNVSSPTAQCTVRYGGKTTTLMVPRGGSTVFRGG